ncbi:MAG: hypothetical protein ACLPIC_16120, partial [Rhodoblastus sp.]|uniref:hypothetical protein n=1 Tax=Rhodoblastus sp. TaxID=1962975 RepID=UPI003F9EB3A6
FLRSDAHVHQVRSASVLEKHHFRRGLTHFQPSSWKLSNAPRIAKLTGLFGGALKCGPILIC